MAIVISAYSVVVQVRTLEAFWPGGEAAYRAAAPNRTYRCDGQLAAVAFMAPLDAAAWVERALDPHGFRHAHAGRAIDLVVVDQMTGPLIPCNWIEFRRAASWGEACLIGAPDAPLSGPEGWAPDAEGVHFTSPEDAAEHLEFLVAKDDLATFRDDRTGKNLYLGLTSEDALSDLIAGRLRVLQRRLDSLRAIADAGGPAKLSGEQRSALEAVASEAGRAVRASPRTTSKALFVSALALRMKGEFARAVPVWQAFTDREPSFPGGWMELTWCCAEAGLKEEALHAARRSVELSPDDAGAMANLGGALLALGRQDEALAWIDQALRTRPDDPVTWNLKRMAGG